MHNNTNLVNCGGNETDINKVFLKRPQTVNNCKRSLIHSSTPISDKSRNMSLSFNKYFQDNLQCTSESIQKPINFDYDSGYVSRNQESNSESSLDVSRENSATSTTKNIYLNEDALLERPESFSKSDEKTFLIHEITQSNSLIAASVECEDLEYSGLIQNDSEASDLSAIIPFMEPLVVSNSLLRINNLRDTSKSNFKDFNADFYNNENNQNYANGVNNVINNLDKSSHGFSFISTRSSEVVDKYIAKESLKMRNSAEKRTESVANSNGKGKILTPSKLCKKSLIPHDSPDLFSDEDTSEPVPHDAINTFQEKYVLTNDHTLLEYVREATTGVLPPPCITNVQLTVDEILDKLYSNRHLMPANLLTCFNNDTSLSSDVATCANNDNSVGLESQSDNKSIKIIPRHQSLLLTSTEECTSTKWPEILEYRYHGLHHNRSKLSEEFEQLCTRYALRYVGVETQSTCTVFKSNISSPSKRKSNKLRWVVKSPGRRLSHLARRRITFTNSALQAGPSGVGSRARQILIDAKKLDMLGRRRSPRKRSPRKTPRKSPQKKCHTPSSSAKKRLNSRLKALSSLQNDLPSTSNRANATKRALFQSPEDSNSSGRNMGSLPLSAGGLTHNVSPNKRKTTPRRALFVSPIFNDGSVNAILPSYKRKDTPKRALFTSPMKMSPTNDNESCDKKRKCTESLDERPSKLPRSLSAQYVSDNSDKTKLFSKTLSETSLRSIESTSSNSSELSIHHKKKLMWAVSEALKTQNVGINHPQFKTYASVLARVTRRCLQKLTNRPRPEERTSERMFRIASQHVYAVIKGKSVDDIMQNAEKNKLKITKPIGYVPLKDAQTIDALQNKENVLKDQIHSSNQINFKNRNNDKVDRIKRVIDFGDDNTSSGPSNTS